MVRKRPGKTPDEEPVAEKGEELDLGCVLAQKALQQVDVQALVSKLAPELADRLLSTIEINSLKECVSTFLQAKSQRTRH